MPLPALPAIEQELVYQELVRSLPQQWFHQLTARQGVTHPLVWGLAGVMARLKLAYQAAQAQSIPALSGGIWLTLHLLGLGVSRKAEWDDERGVREYQWVFEQNRNTRTGQLKVFERIGLEPSQYRLETDFEKGRYGELRVVIDAPDVAWDELELEWIAEFLARYLSNGITPSLKLNLRCILSRSLRPWQFSSQFPMSWNTTGPFWERRSLTDPLRLRYAVCSFYQMDPVEWQTYKGWFRAIHESALGAGNPGALFWSLTTQGECPYVALEEAVTATPENVVDWRIRLSDAAVMMPRSAWWTDATGIPMLRIQTEDTPLLAVEFRLAKGQQRSLTGFELKEGNTTLAARTFAAAVVDSDVNLGLIVRAAV